MTSANNRASGTHSSRSRRSRSRTWSAIIYLWSQWRLEVIVAILVTLAIFLLVENVEIRQTLANWLGQAVDGATSFAGRAVESAGAFVRATTVSDLTAYFFLLVALVLVVWRIRWRLVTTPRFIERQCPRCGGDLYRIHRHTTDRLLHLFVPVRRYRCRDRACGWSGVRVQTRR